MKRMNIKKMLALALAAVVAATFLSCSSDGGSSGDGSEQGGSVGSKSATLTVKNASSYTLHNVKWDGKEVSSTAGIAPGYSKKESVSEGFGYIYFSFYPDGSDEMMSCYTAEVLDISEGDDASFTFTNNTIVVQLNNTGNRKTLELIQFPTSAMLSILFDGRLVEKNDVIDLGKIVTNAKKSAEFQMTNSGKDVLRFIGNAPISSSDNCIEISTQPTNSTLSVNNMEAFEIAYSAAAVGSYSSVISIASNDETSPYTFTVKYSAAEPAPELSVQYGEETIANEGTIDFGQVILEKSRTIEISLLNTETKKLTLTGSPSVSLLDGSDCFEVASQPIPEISAGNSSKCMIKYTPSKEGEESAVLKIVSDDPENENTYIYLKGTGLKVYPTFRVYKNTGSTASSDIVSDNATVSNTTKIRKDQTASWNFKIENTSSEVDLRLSVHAETAGSAISVSETDIVIAPRRNGTFTVLFNPNGTVASFSERIILTTNCESPEFAFTVSFTSRDFGTEAFLSDIYDLGGTVSPAISPNEKNYEVTFDSDYYVFEVRRNDVECSNYASVYFDGILLDASSKSFGVSDEKSYTMKIVSEDESHENEYTFTFKAKDKYDDTSFSAFYLKTTSGTELDITNSLTSGIYYTKNHTFSLKPVLNNPNAKVYIGAQNASISNMTSIGSNTYSSKVSLMDYPYDGVLCIVVVSESWLMKKRYTIIAD